MRIQPVFILPFLLLLGCDSKQQLMDMDHLHEFVRNDNNGLIVKKNDAGFSIEVSIKPNDLIVQQQLEQGTRREIDSISNELASYLYVILDIRKDGKDLETWMGSRSVDFAQGISFLSADFAQHISLISKQKRFAPAEYLYTRSYGLTGSRFLVVFERPNDDFEISVQGNDLGFGDVTFPFQLKNIKNIPSLLFTEI